MRLTRRNADGTLTPIRLAEQGEVKADHTLYYRCRLAIGDAAFEDVGAGDDPKAAYSDAIKRAAVRAGIGESLYAMDAPWLRVGDAEHQLRVSRAGKPYLDERTIRWLQQHVRGVADPRRRRSWRAAPARAGPDPARRLRDAHRRPAHRREARGADADARDGNLIAVTPPAIPDIPDAPDAPSLPPAEPADGEAAARRRRRARQRRRARR